MYVSPDASLDVRRHNMLKRLEERHEKEVKVTTEGAIFVDNVLAFSIKDGFPKHSAAGSTSHDA